MLVDITKDVTAAKCEYKKEKPYLIPQPKRYTDADIDNALELLKASERPFIYVGGGAIISGASAELAEFVKKMDAPVCDSLMGKGAYDGTADNYTGMIGMHGTKTANIGVSKV